MRLKDKVAIITGASSGIGEGIAKAFLEEGAKVVGVSRKQGLSFTGDRVLHIIGDVSNPDDTDRIVKEAVEKFGKLDILVNSAGITQIGSLETLELEDFEREFDINVKGVFNMCKSSIGQLKKQRGASIVNIGSDLGVRPIEERIAYCPSKAAAIMLTKCIALEYAPDVRANCINPGLIETRMIADRIKSDEDRQAMGAMYPLKKIGLPEDIAKAAVYLASDESNFVTGESIAVSGGSLI